MTSGSVLGSENGLRTLADFDNRLNNDKESYMGKAPLELLKGTLDLLILRTLRPGPLHGYGISLCIRNLTESAFQVEEGAMYPALRRLEKKGLLDAEWGTTETGREAKFYRLTPAGQSELSSELGRWRRYVQAMDRVLGAEGRA